MAAGIGAALVALAQRAGALPLDPDRRRRRAAADPRDPVSADAFDGSALFRMNTVFKAGYQAFLLLGLAAGVRAAVGRRLAAAARLDAVGGDRRGAADPRARLSLRGRLRATGGFANAPTLDGLKWLSARSPGDPGAIDWLRANAPGDAVVLEAFGDDYSAFGHARISTFTGRPTVIGWAGPRGPVAARPGLARRRRPDALHDARRRRRAGADRPLRHPLRRLRTDRADDVRRRRPGQVGSAGRAGLRTRRHHGLGTAVTRPVVEPAIPLRGASSTPRGVLGVLSRVVACLAVAARRAAITDVARTGRVAAR